MKYCNCSVGFLFPAVGYPECNVTQIFCLIKYNEIFNAEKPLVKNPFFDENEEGIVCNCLPECSRIDYGVEVNPIDDEKIINGNFVVIDVHYRNRVMMKYRTDVTFSGKYIFYSYLSI